MRGIDIFCTSQAATAIGLSSMEDPSSSSSSLSFPSLSSSSTGHLGSSRLIDRHNPIITDPKRVPRSPPFNSPPQSKTTISTPKNDRTSKSKKQKKKSGSSDSGWKSSGASVRGGAVPCAKGGDFISPAGSTRYLLGERTGLSEALSDFDPVLSLVPGSAPTKTKSEVKKLDDEEAGSISTRASSSGSSDQVVVLRVSLHCKGCAGKVRKHISRMPGVTSFSVDFAAKKVTVMGDVTPLEVLASISKVKTAQLWTPPVGPPPSIPSPPQSTLSEAEGYSGLVVTS